MTPDRVHLLDSLRGPVTAMRSWDVTTDQRHKALSSFDAEGVIRGLGDDVSRSTLLDVAGLARLGLHRAFALPSEDLASQIVNEIRNGSLLLLRGWVRHDRRAAFPLAAREVEAGIPHGEPVPPPKKKTLPAVALSDRATITEKIARQMGPRSWTHEAIEEAIRSGRQIPAVNKATGNAAIRYVHPQTGQSVVVDTVTNEVIHVGGPGFKYSPGSGDIP